MNYLIAILLIGLLILIHELGHLLAAKLVKIRIATFSIGFGPKIASILKNNTEYRLSLIPLGGYVMPDIKDESEFFNIPAARRIIFSMGGIVANILLPVIVFAILNIMQNGISISGIFIDPVKQTFSLFITMIFSILKIFDQPGQLSGIIGIVVQGENFIAGNFLKAMNFLIMLSLNLSVINLLPIPALDGGKIILYAMEKIHPKFIKLHLPFSMAGWIIILGITLYTTYQDFGRYIIKIFA